MEFPPIQVTLRDGRSVTLREVRPDDAAAFKAALDGLSADALHSRFFSAIRPTHAMVERAVTPRAEGERALVAIAGEGGSVAGGGRCINGKDGESCEFAVMIVDEWRGAGLASTIMRALIRDARARGLKRMDGYVLAQNKPMLDLARRLHFEVRPSDEGPSVKLVQLDLAGR